MFTYFSSGFVFALLVIANLIMAKTNTTKEMYSDLWQEQNIVGKIFANAFYLLAWLLKLLKWIFNGLNK